MTLSSGTQFGSYLVSGPLGVGGMGEVYRATDTNLKRDVAIKVLPESFAKDADRLARFQREAEVLAALNHVNIAHIYGLERSAGVTALVMELVDGQTLAERLEQGALPADEALNIAMQIAEALEAAHERGIVHRDLKPANIKLASNGVVKVLDFGIAKALDTKTISGPLAAQLTTPAMTEAGIVLGTAAYMSPEQARGKPVDQRADIWAFGCLLYEMLTGQVAFGGEDVTTTLARILERGADMSALPAISADLRQALKLCLQKDLKKRVADIRDVKLLLTGAFEIANTQQAAPAKAATARSGWFVAAAAALVAVMLAIPAIEHLRETAPPPPPETRLEIVTPTTDSPYSFALSPDGKQIVFIATYEGQPWLWLRSLDATAAQVLPGTQGADFPFWSPDSKSLGFFAGNEMKRMDLGSLPYTLAPVVTGRGGSWMEDGTILFAPSRTTPLQRMPAGGGNVEALTRFPLGHNGHMSPLALPDGRHFLFYANGTPDSTGVFLGALDGSREPVLLTPSAGPGLYHPSGRLLWVRNNTLVAQQLDVERGALVGDPVALAEGVYADDTLNRTAGSVSATGTIAYRVGSDTLRQLTWLDSEGKVAGTVGEPDATLMGPRLDNTGRRVVVTRMVQNNRDLWLFDDTRSTRLTFDPAQEIFPVWAPDGTRIAFRSNRGSSANGVADIYELTVNNTGSDRLMIADDALITPTSWSADGKYLLYFANDVETNADIWTATMDGQQARSLVLQTPAREAYGEFSPDGRWVAYHSNASGRTEIYIRPYSAPGASAPAATSQWQVTTEGGVYARWSLDGTALYYLAPTGAMMRVPITITGDALESGAPVKLFDMRIYSGGVDQQLGRMYDIAPDGRFLIIQMLDDADAPITLLQNWNPEATQ